MIEADNPLDYVIVSTTDSVSCSRVQTGSSDRDISRGPVGLRHTEIEEQDFEAIFEIAADPTSTVGVLLYVPKPMRIWNPQMARS